MFGTSILLSLFLSVFGCASGDNGGEGRESGGDGPDRLQRITLVDIVTHDSARAAQPAILDGMLRQAFDSIPEMTYVTFHERGSKIPGSDSGMSTADLAEALDLSAVLSLRIARFGSVVGADMRALDPGTGTVLFHDRAFSFIRYRDEEDNLLFGPALYEVVERLVHRMARRPDSERLVVSAEPLVIGSVVIEKDPALGKIGEDRVKISKNGVRALGDFARVSHPEFIVFDYESRGRIYETVGLSAVEDHAPVGNLERQALFNLDVPYMLNGSIRPAPNDSIEFGVELRYINGPASDTLVDQQTRRFDRGIFETATTERDAISLMRELADELR